MSERTLRHPERSEGSWDPSAALRLQDDEETALQQFRLENPRLFQKDDAKLFLHLGIVATLLLAGTIFVIASPSIWVKIPVGAVNAFFWFSLVNVTIHHHHTHHNAAKGGFAKKLLDVLYFLAVPDAPKRLGRYTRAHLNHHARPFHETDVDHYYGKTRYLSMRGFKKILYYLELTFVGAHVPGWEDDRYMNQAPLEAWNRADYESVKIEERKKALRLSLFQWSLFGASLYFLPAVAWGWAFPMLLVKNWAHFLGQFQHYDDRLTDASRTVWNRTKTYHFPGWLNYLAGGEISGHFLHHLFPEIPYYNVEAARRRLLENPELSKLFVTY